MARTLKVKPDSLERVNRTFDRNGHYTQEDFGEGINLHPDTVRKFLKGKAVSRKSFFDICEALELDPLEITFESDGADHALAAADAPDDQVKHSDDEAEASETENSASEDQAAAPLHPKAESGIQINQTITHNSGLVIGNVQGNVTP
jgi:hypothetical protein